MLNRRVLLAGMLFVLVSHGAAGAQTMTTSTTTTTTTTTVERPCLVYECTGRPPDAFVSGSGGEVEADQGGYCWRPPGPDGTLSEVGVCTLTGPIDPEVALRVEQGETLSVRFATRESPSEFSVRHFPSLTVGQPATVLPATAGNPARFRADLPPGVVLVNLGATWLQGSGSYVVKLDVRAPARPADPAQRPVRFTG